MSANPYFIKVGRVIINVAEIQFMEIAEDNSLALHFSNHKKPIIHLRDDDPVLLLKHLKAMDIYAKVSQAPAASE